MNTAALHVKVGGMAVRQMPIVRAGDLHNGLFKSLRISVPALLIFLQMLEAWKLVSIWNNSLIIRYAWIVFYLSTKKNLFLA